MQKGIQMLDNRARLIFHQMCHRSQSEYVTKLQRHTPLFICQNGFTNILNEMFAKHILQPNECKIKKYLHDNAVGENAAVKTLMDLLYVDKLKAQHIVKSSLMFESMTRQNLIHNYDFLLSLGYDTNTILKHVKVLAQSRQSLSEKIEYFKNVTDIRPQYMELNFFQYPMDSLMNFTKIYQSMNKKSSINDTIEYNFAKELKVDADSMFKLMAAYLHPMTSQPEDTIRKLKILMAHGVSLEELCGLPKLNSKLSYEQLRDRIKILEENSIKVKLCKLNMREVMFNRLIGNCPKSAPKTEYEQLVNYLSEKSGYSKLFMEFTVDKLSRRKLTFLSSLETINLLLDLGYDYEDIIYQPKLLTYPIETIKSQFNVPKLSKLNAI